MVHIKTCAGKAQAFLAGLALASAVYTPKRVSAILIMAMLSVEASAQFSLDFRPNDGSYISNPAYVSCHMSYIPDANCGGGMMGGGGGGGGGMGMVLNGSHDDGSAFYQRMFSDAAGNRYFQVIVGDYTVDSFALEFIIRTGYAGDGSWFTDINRSSSAGNPNNPTYNMTSPYDTATTPPTDSGTGTGNPTRVIMRQLLQDGEGTQTFLKDQFDKKPMVQQIFTNAQFNMNFVLDMRGKNYSTLSAIDPSKVTLTVNLLDPASASIDGNFNFAVDANNTHITAGGYTYAPGSGAGNYGGSNGRYSYVDGAFGDFFDPREVDYSIYCNPADNVDWSGNGACTNAAGAGNNGGMGGGGMGGGGGGGM